MSVEFATPVPAEKPDSYFRAALRSPSFMIGATITAVFVLMALISFVWTPYNYAAQDIPDKLKGM